jgi:hypothetical protein
MRSDFQKSLLIGHSLFYINATRTLVFHVAFTVIECASAVVHLLKSSRDDIR